MSKIDDIITGIIDREGREYTNHPSDRGGPTRYGITQKTLQHYRGVTVYPEDVQRLTEREARNIYYDRYVKKPSFDDVLPHSEAIAVELIDAGVMSGPARPIIWLQRALNALNKQQKLYADIAEDGALGPKTVGALVSFLTYRGNDGETVILRALNGQQADFLIDIARGRPKNEDFVFGWLLHRVT